MYSTNPRKTKRFASFINEFNEMVACVNLYDKKKNIKKNADQIIQIFEFVHINFDHFMTKKNLFLKSVHNLICDIENRVKALYELVYMEDWLYETLLYKIKTYEASAVQHRNNK